MNTARKKITHLIRLLQQRRSQVVTILMCVIVIICITPHSNINTIKIKCVGYISMQSPQYQRSNRTCHERFIASDKSFEVTYGVLSYPELIRRHGNDLAVGGHYRPPNCQAVQTVAIVVPYRDREENLKMLLNNLHPFLKRQSINYRIFVAEQLPGTKFNRGMIKNIGFIEAGKLFDFDCVFFHDVDMTPDDLGNVYRCGDRPRLHAINMERWNHTLSPSYKTNFGGVVSMRAEQFYKVNGYSNAFFEWGNEDDELKLRFEAFGFEIDQYPFEISSYKEFSHKKLTNDVLRSTAWYNKWTSRLENDGLTALFYSVEKVVLNPLYTHIYANLNMTAMQTFYEGRLGGLS